MRQFQEILNWAKRLDAAMLLAKREKEVVCSCGGRYKQKKSWLECKKCGRVKID